MEGTNIREKHFLKIVSFVLGYALLLGITVLSVYGVDEQTPLVREVLQGTVVELVGVGLAVVFYVCLLRKKLTAAAEYRLAYSNKKLVVGLFLICPFLVFLYANISHANFSNIYQIVEKTSWVELGKDLLFFPLGAVLGPVFEEFCCRVMCISCFKSMKGKIIALIFTTLIFALCHGADFVTHIPSGLVFGIVFIASRNIMLTISLHMAWNTATFVVPDLSQAVALLTPGEVMGIWDAPIIAMIIFVVAFIVGIFFIIKGKKIS